MHVRPVARHPGAHSIDAWSCVVLLAVLWVYLAFGRTFLLSEILAVPLVLLIPGGLLVMMLPSRPENLYFQLALAVGLSIAVCIGVGLLLNMLPTGIDHRSWTYALASITMAEAVIVASQRSRAGKSRSGSPAMLARMSVRHVIFATIAIVLIVGGLIAGVAWERSNAEGAYRKEHFAEVWVEPASGRVSLVGVRSDISGTNRFRLSLSVDGRAIKEYSFTLRWQQTWSGKISVPPGAASRVLISLFDGSSSQPTERARYNLSTGT